MDRVEAYGKRKRTWSERPTAGNKGHYPTARAFVSNSYGFPARPFFAIPDYVYGVAPVDSLVARGPRCDGALPFGISPVSRFRLDGGSEDAYSIVAIRRHPRLFELRRVSLTSVRRTQPSGPQSPTPATTTRSRRRVLQPPPARPPVEARHRRTHLADTQRVYGVYSAARSIAHQLRKTTKQIAPRGSLCLQA